MNPTNTQNKFEVGFLYQEEPFTMSTEKGPMTLRKTYFITAEKQIIIYFLKEKINIELDIPPVTLVTEFKPNAKGKLEMSVKDVLI